MKAGYGFENPHPEFMCFHFWCLLAFLSSLVYVCHHHRFGFVLPLSWARLLLLCTSSSFPRVPTEEVEKCRSFCSALVLVLPLCWALLVLAAITLDLVVVVVLLTSAQVVCVLPSNWASLMLAATFHLLRAPSAFLACCRHYRLPL
jgi:hypothetical protein